MRTIKPTQNYKELLKKEFNHFLSSYEYLSGNEMNFKADMVKLCSPKGENLTKPKVLCMAEAWFKMQTLVKSNELEVQWHCLVRRDIEKNLYVIYDVLMYKQQVTGVSTTCKDDEYATWLMQIMMDEDETKFDNLRCHGHSHVNMQCFSSGRDDQYRESLIQNIKEDDYYIFLILNKKNEVNVWLYDFAANIIFERNDLDFAMGFEDGTTYDDWGVEQNKLVEKPERTYGFTKGWNPHGRPGLTLQEEISKRCLIDRDAMSTEELEADLEKEFRRKMDQDTPPRNYAQTFKDKAKNKAKSDKAKKGGRVNGSK